MLAELDGLYPPDQSFWIVCACLYLVDHVRLHSGREMILRETMTSGWVPVFPLQGYRLRRQAVTVLPPFFPFLAAIKLPWLTGNAFSQTRLRRADKLIWAHQRYLAPYRLLASLTFLMLFVAGPLLTSKYGLAYALAFFLPAHIIGVALLAISLAFGREAFRMEWSQVAAFVFECAVCPGFFANICRKVSLVRTGFGGDAVGYCLNHSSHHAVVELGRRLDEMVEDIEAWDGGEDADNGIASAYRTAFQNRATHV